MTRLDDITGVARCSGKKSRIDLTDRELWALLEMRFPGVWVALLAHRAPGERVHIPHALETPRERAEAVDDGEMSLRQLARVAGVAYGTARVARNEKGRV